LELVCLGYVIILELVENFDFSCKVWEDNDGEVDIFGLTGFTILVGM